MFCKHEWEKVTEEILPAKLETLKSTGVDFEVFFSSTILEMATKTHIVILKCVKCGKIYKSVTKG